MVKKLNEGVFGYQHTAVNTIKVKTLLEDENFKLYLINGEKYDSTGSGVSYNNDLKIQKKDPMKKYPITLTVDYDPMYNEYNIQLLLGPTKTSGNYIKVNSIKELVEGLQKANDFKSKALKIVKGYKRF